MSNVKCTIPIIPDCRYTTEDLILINGESVNNLKQSVNHGALDVADVLPVLVRELVIGLLVAHFSLLGVERLAN